MQLTEFLYEESHLYAGFWDEPPKYRVFFLDLKNFKEKKFTSIL